MASRALIDLGSGHKPVAFYPRFLGIGAEMGLAATPTIQDDLVAGFPACVGGRFHGPREVDAGNHREPAHDRAFAGHGEAVFVIERGIFNANGNVTVHQVGFVEISERGLGAAIRLLDDDCLEHRHAPLACLYQAFVAPEEKIVQAPQAGAIAGRAIGFSTMGKLMSADITPKNTESHHTG